MEEIGLFNEQDKMCSIRTERNIGSGLHVYGREEIRAITREDGSTYTIREVFCKACGDLIKREFVPAEQT